MLWVFVALAAILTFAAIYSKNALMGIVGAGFWLAIWQYLTQNYILIAATADDPMVTTVLVACVGAALATFLVPILQDRQSDATASGGLARIRRFVNHGDVGNGNAPKRRTLYDATPEEYSQIVHNAVHRNGARRRR
jgi:hypothetical protein